MKKIIATFVLAVLLAPCFAFADGGMIRFDPYSDRWDFSDETNQQAFINFENGTEKMILSVGIGDLSEGKTMWIFPVPADPNKVAVDVVTKLPSLRGEEISEKAQSNLEDAKKWLQATQIYTITFAFLGRSMLGASSMPKSTALSNSWGNPESVSRLDVVVYEHLEKEGITSEIVTARTTQGFNEYFSKKGLKIDANSIPVLQNYIGKDYSFVVSWIDKTSNASIDEFDTKTNKILKTNEELITNLPDEAIQQMIIGVEKGLPDIREYFQKNPNDVKGYISSRPWAETIVIEYLQKNRPDLAYKLETVQVPKPKPTTAKNQKGVFVSFPTEKIFFPLMPTSVYGSKIVPAEIRVMGHVTPDVFSDIESFTKTEYFWDENIQFDKDLKSFYNGSNRDIKYTKVEINAPSKFFTSDLWMKNSAPAKTFYQMFLARQFLPIVFFLIIICSVITGALVGILLFREWRSWEGMKKFSFIGLANCLTILGMIAMILPSKTKKDAEDAAPEIEKIKEKGYYWKKRLVLGLIIADLPFLLISIFAIPFSIMNLLNDLARVDYYRYFWLGDLFLIGISMLPVIILVPVWFLARIKSEDKRLFLDLKSKNYSAWTFQPKDKRKIAFILLYSTAFLVISWIVVKLLVFSVGGEMISSINSGVPF